MKNIKFLLFISIVATLKLNISVPLKHPNLITNSNFYSIYSNLNRIDSQNFQVFEPHEVLILTCLKN